MSTPTHFKLIYSGGGPYILATRSSAFAWLGTEGLSAGDASRYKNDYERACDVKDYAGAIAGSPNEILVIDDLPYEMMWLSDSPNTGLLIKWIGADSDEQVQAALKDVDTESFEDFPLQIELAEPELFLFDSAWRLANIGDNYLKLMLQPGRYAVSTLIYEPNDRVSLHLIRLKRIPELAGPGAAS